MTRSDCSLTTSVTELKKFSTSLLGVKHTRTPFDFLITCESYQGSIIAQVTDDIEKAWKDVHSILEKFSNSGTLKPVLRFPFVSGGGRG